MKNFVVFIIILFIFFTLLFITVTAQDSNEEKTSALSGAINAGEYLLKGIINSRYKKPGWREYLMPDRFEIPPAYVSTLSPHPRLITISQIYNVKTRINQQPYSEWYTYLVQYANSNNSSYGLVREKAKKLKALAFLYHLNRDNQYLTRAISLFNELPEAPKIVNLEGGAPNRGWGDFLQCADAIPDICAAYDLLFNQLPNPLKESVKQKTLSVVKQLIDAINITPRNNHITVFTLAIATSSLTFDNTQNYIFYDNQGLYNLSMDYLSQSLGLIAPDGGYGEGPGYSQYILQYLSQFSVYQENCFGQSLFNNSRLERMVNWLLDNYKGSGSFTQFDDAYDLNKFYLPLIVHLTPSGSKWIEAFNQFPSQNKYSSNMVEALCIYRKKNNKSISILTCFCRGFLSGFGPVYFS